MKRVRKIVADDVRNEVRVSIRVEVNSRNGLSAAEVEKVMRSLVRGISGTLPSVPYTDYGIDNTKILRA